MRAGKILILVVLGTGLLAGYLSIHSGSSPADFRYTVNAPLSNSITITDYTGAGGRVSIPPMLNGLPVTCLGRGAFFGRTNLVSVTIPSSVTNIESWAFTLCTSLQAINVDAANNFFCSLDGVLYNKAKTKLIQYPEGKFGNFNIPDGVSSIESEAFVYCSGAEYTNLTEVCFEGNAPDADPNIFYGTDRVIVYYLPGTTGWAEKFGSHPTALRRQQIPNRSSP